MNYFILIYHVQINGETIHNGKVIKATNASIFLESEIVPAIENEYRYAYPDAEFIKVTIIKARETTYKAYTDFYKSKERQVDATIGFLIDRIK